MVQVSILTISILLQFLAAVLALSLIRVTRQRIAWILIAIALVLMTARRVDTLGRLLTDSASSKPLEMFNVLGLMVSVLMVLVFLYIRRYFFDIFATARTLRQSEERYRTLAQNIPDAAVFLFDLNRRVILAEGPLLSREVLPRQPISWMSPSRMARADTWWEMFSPLVDSALKGSEARVQRDYGGRTFSIQVVPVREPNGQVSGGMALAMDVSAEIGAEKERAAAYDFLQHTIDGVAEPIMVIDLDYRVSLMNRIVRESYTGLVNSQDVLCYQVSHHRNAPCNGLSHPCPVAQIRETFLPVTVVHQHQTATGELRQVEIMASPLMNESGRLVGVIEACRDITERERAIETVRKLSQAIAQSPAAVMIADLMGKIEYVNPKFTDLTGYTLEDVSAGNPMILSEELTTPERSTQLWEVLRSGRVWRDEFPNRKKSGEPYWESATVSPVRDARGVITHIVAVKEDVSKRKRAEEESHRHTKDLEILAKMSAALRGVETRSEIYSALLKHLVGVFQSTAAAIVIRDRAVEGYRCALGYLEWESWTGRDWPRDLELTRRVVANTPPGPEPSSGPISQPLEAGLFGSVGQAACVPLIAHGAAIGALWLGGSEVMTEAEMRLLDAIGDMVANAIQRQSLLEDLGHQLDAVQVAQARMVQSEKLAALGQLLSGVAHELNNPLTSVVLFSQLVQQNRLDEKARDNLEKVVSEALRASRIVRALLDFARQRPLDRRIIQVNDEIKDCLDLVAYELRAHHVRLDLDLDPALPSVLADGHQLRQVLVNLINNAWQAISQTQEQGHLRIISEHGPSAYAPLPGEDRMMARVRIIDDGPGITPTDLPRIFDPFFTTKPEGSGTGLGLSICHGIINEHGGHIWAESNAAGGSTFFVELPIAKEVEPRDGKGRTVSAEPLQEKGRILILDDEVNIQDVLGQALRRRGYVVDTAGNGAEGLARLEQREYDFILCDIRMPDVSGVDFYRKLEAEHPRSAQKVIFITGDTVSAGTRKFIEESGVRYLAKPFELSEVMAILRPSGRAPGERAP